MKRLHTMTAISISAALTGAAIGGAQSRERTGDAASRADAFAGSDGIVDLMVTGSAARTLYDRLPGKGEAQACGASGLHKGNGRISCVLREGDYSCHLWLDVPKQALTEPETDDC